MVFGLDAGDNDFTGVGPLRYTGVRGLTLGARFFVLRLGINLVTMIVPHDYWRQILFQPARESR